MIAQRPADAAPSVQARAEALPFRDNTVEITVVPIPADCADGFLGAYWKRPRAYLDAMVRESISTFSRIGEVDAQLARLESDIESGAWEQRYSDLSKVQVDLGYRIVVAPSPKLARLSLPA